MNPIGLEAWLALLLGENVGTYSADSAFPMITSGGPRRDWMRYLLWGELPDNRRVYCGMTVPEYLSDIETLRSQCNGHGLSYGETDSAETLIWRLITHLSSVQFSGS